MYLASFECSYPHCGKEFEEEDKLMSHEQIHTEEKKFKVSLSLTKPFFLFLNVSTVCLSNEVSLCPKKKKSEVNFIKSNFFFLRKEIFIVPKFFFR